MLRPNSALARPPEGAQKTLHVDSFDVRYRADGSVEQFVSELAVQGDDGQPLEQRTVSVNIPLRYKARLFKSIASLKDFNHVMGLVMPFRLLVTLSVVGGVHSTQSRRLCNLADMLVLNR